MRESFTVPMANSENVNKYETNLVEEGQDPDVVILLYYKHIKDQQVELQRQQGRSYLASDKQG